MKIRKKTKDMADIIENIFVQGWKSRHKRRDFLEAMLEQFASDPAAASDPTTPGLSQGEAPQGPRTVPIEHLYTILLSEADHLEWLADRVKEAGISMGSVSVRMNLFAMAKFLRGFVSAALEPLLKDAPQKVSDIKWAGDATPSFDRGYDPRDPAQAARPGYPEKDPPAATGGEVFDYVEKLRERVRGKLFIYWMHDGDGGHEIIAYKPFQARLGLLEPDWQAETLDTWRFRSLADIEPVDKIADYLLAKIDRQPPLMTPPAPPQMYQQSDDDGDGINRGHGGPDQ